MTCRARRPGYASTPAIWTTPEWTLSTLRRYADRTDYIHFKDIDAAKYADVMSRRIRFFDACAEGASVP